MPLPRPTPEQRRWWIVGILGCGAALALVVWFGLSATVGRVSWQTTSYDVVAPDEVVVTFVVHRPANTAVTCQVKAMDVRFAAVGLLDVEIPAGPERSVSRSAAVRTTAEAVTGNVQTCTKG